MGTDIVTTRTNNYFCEKKIKCHEQIVIYKEQKY